MAEINFNELQHFLALENGKVLPQLFMASGEDFLTRKAFDQIIKRLLPKEKRELSYELLEGSEAELSNVMERISTYSFEDLLVVALKNAPLFSVTTSKQEIETFQEFIKKPFPDGHFLVLTTDVLDRRKAIFKAIREIGIVVDCATPKGSRKADKTQQTVLLRATMDTILFSAQKGIDNDAFSFLVDQTGFDPDTFSDNLNKLVSFIGERKSITVQDVKRVVKRTRKDAIFEFTNAVADRNPSEALFYLQSLLKGGFHPLQIITALTNQLRKLLLVKLFVEECKKKEPCWQKGKSYTGFIQDTMPGIEQADASIAATAALWEETLAFSETRDIKKKNSTTDLLIAPNPKNTYPVYHTFMKSDNFTLEELVTGLTQLNEVDLKMKSSSNDPAIVLDNFVIGICTIRRN